ncbi:hypothetical protein [uncultured Thalassospira sp.]|uniref:hypothetical protein n=1 Tax=uncultured Thalassospira sp. TaxID=404382 RepID=UPI0025886D87|nr:hypothetical protein [uncultured Thalassospira sp.]
MPVTDIVREPLKFLIQNRTKKIQFSGRVFSANLANDASRMIVMVIGSSGSIESARNHGGIFCVTTDPNMMQRMLSSDQGAQLIATGTLVGKEEKLNIRTGRTDQFLVIEECKAVINSAVQDPKSDPSTLLGTWCEFDSYGDGTPSWIYQVERVGAANIYFRQVKANKQHTAWESSFDGQHLHEYGFERSGPGQYKMKVGSTTIKSMFVEGLDKINYVSNHRTKHSWVRCEMAK